MANYDLGIFTGHGQGGVFDPGACGNNKREYDVAKQLTDKTISLLRPLFNIQTGENNYDNNLTKDNKYRLSFCMTYHLNSSINLTATGTEILVPSREKNLTFETKVNDRISKLLGIPNRGIKSRNYDTDVWHNRTNGQALNFKDWFRECREAWNNGTSLSILEIGFISNSNDINKIMANLDSIARIVAEEIASLDGKTLPPANVEGVYRVICGSYKEKVNAEKQVQVLSSKGIKDTFIAFYDDTKTYRVVSGSYAVKVNAENKVKDLKAKGVDCFIAFYKN